MKNKIAKSARGVSVNFDLIQIKQQIATAPKPTNVKAREDHIDQKLKRRLRRLTQAANIPTPSDEPSDTPLEE